jgi:LuxR family transcriptional regulator of csgAB operon
MGMNATRHYNAPDKNIYLIGASKIQISLLADFIKNEVGLTCLPNNDISRLTFKGNGYVPGSLVLFDCQGKDGKQILTELKSFKDNTSSEHRIVLFNLDDDLRNEEEYVWEGVQGLFYLRDPIEQFLKGIRTLLQGELWLSRDLMSRCIRHGNRGLGSSEGKKKAVLTKRQAEILALVAVGYSNEEIASRLYISAHTVKTHLYTIFKKIKVPNRMQASLWAAKNL